MNTRRIYQDHVYSTSCQAEITGIDLTRDHVRLTFDATVFFPEGGGQSSDVGTMTLLSGAPETGGAVTINGAAGKDGAATINGAAGKGGAETINGAAGKDKIISIIDVFEEGDAVCHETDLPVPEDPDELPFRPGARVLLSIDWAHRFDNMQRHLGEHILSGAIHRLYGGINKGFHMGDRKSVV